MLFQKKERKKEIYFVGEYDQFHYSISNLSLLWVPEVENLVFVSFVAAHNSPGKNQGPNS